LKNIQELQDLYDNANEEGKQWMHDNLHLWFGKEKPIDLNQLNS